MRTRTTEYKLGKAIRKLARNRTKEGFISRLYANQVTHSIGREHSAPSYNLEWLREWLLSQDLFHKLFKEWEISEYDKWLAPSVNRKRNEIGYTEENIELMTWKENSHLAYRTCRSSSRR